SSSPAPPAGRRTSSSSASTARSSGRPPTTTAPRTSGSFPSSSAGKFRMSAPDSRSAQRPEPDAVLSAIAGYARNFTVRSESAYETARYCLMDTLACGFQALKYPACRKLLGPVVPGAVMPGGARVPGTSFELDPVQAAFNIGAMIRWLDFNDTWLAAEWGHPSDNLGSILAVADYLARNGKRVLVRDVLTGMIKAHEIQGVLALENSFNRVGLDHV